MTTEFTQLVRLTAVIGALMLAIGVASAQELLTNGGFEGRFAPLNGSGKTYKGTGEIADGWLENSQWADVDVRYERVTDTPHGGESCQRITATRFGGGAVQMAAKEVTLQANRGYLLQAWVRSASQTPVSVLLRQPGPPYTSYVEKTITPGPEWQRVRLFLASPGNVPVWFMTILRGVGSVDVDDCSLKIAPEESDDPAQVGSLLPAARLGAGIPTAWHFGVGYSALESDPAAGPVGRGALKVTIPAGRELMVYSPPEKLAYGRQYTLSLYAKSEPAGVKMEFAIGGLKEWWKGAAHWNGAVPGEWQRLSASGKVPVVNGERYAVWLKASGPGTVWLDGLQLEEGATATEFKPKYPATISVTPEEPWGVFVGDEPETVKVGIVGQIPAGSKLRMRAVHVDGSTDELPTLNLAAGETWSSSVVCGSTSCRKFGLVRIEATVVGPDAKALSEQGETLLARVGKPTPGPDDKSRFGIHVELRDPDVTVAAKLGYKWTRMHDASIFTKWGIVEPEPGKWVWHDAEIDLALSHGLKIMGMLCSSPPWASGHQGEQGYFSIYYPPKDISQWRNYVRTVVARYKGKIDNWEVWNEPWGNGLQEGFFRGGTPEQYAELLKAAYDEAKKANPQCTIMGVDTYGGTNWDAKVLAAGAYPSFDVMSFHSYTNQLWGKAGDEPGGVAKHLRGEMRQYGAEQPLWDTEGGPGDGPDHGSFLSIADPELYGDWSRCADMVARMYIGLDAAKVDRFFLYSIHNWGQYGAPSWMLVDTGPLLPPLHLTVNALIRFTEGAAYAGRGTPAKGVSAQFYRRGETLVAVLFADGESVVPLEKAVPAGVKCFDRWGNPCPTPTKALRGPTYLVATGGQRTALKKALGAE